MVSMSIPTRRARIHGMAAPRKTHWCRASCEEVGCQNHQHGFAVYVLPGTREEAVVRASPRTWSAIEKTEDGWLRFVYPPGTPCFESTRHVKRIDRPFLLYTRDGRTGESQRFDHSSDWVDHFQTQLQRVSDFRARG